MRWLFLVGLATLAGSCGGGDCVHGSNIQVTVAPDGDVVVSDIVRLHVMLSINDTMLGATDILVGPDKPLDHSGSTFLLQPDPAPAASYNVALTVQAYATGDALVAIGSNSVIAVTDGCNRLTVNLTALPLMTPGPDMAAPPGSDLAGTTVESDMAGCIGGTPDEDADGRANFCDLCPADPDTTPVDSDSDGLPDACDPDIAMPTNTLVYFDPFDTASGHWSGSHQVTQSYMKIDTGAVGTDSSSNGVDLLPLNVRVQTDILPTHEYGNQGGDTGVFVGTSANPNQGNGVFCALTWNNGAPDTVNIYHVNSGSYGVPSTLSLGNELQMLDYRLRLTHRAGTWTCEVVPNGGAPITVTTSQTVTAPLFITLINDNMGSNFHHVVVETKL
ncbi:MAG TPA: hypothetical protein VN947_27250 [Polyangia bacterium]|nr:hypothetical protein [Polyangia bacterium]